MVAALGEEDSVATAAGNELVVVVVAVLSCSIPSVEAGGFVEDDIDWVFSAVGFTGTEEVEEEESASGRGDCLGFFRLAAVDLSAAVL